jgi:hypothetical protein
MAPAVFTANALTDTGAGGGTVGDLRYCITQANATAGPNTINITATGTIGLTSALPTIASGHDLTITGPGASQLTINANSNSRIFVDSTSSFSISGVTLAKGAVSGVGAGIQLTAANENLTITNSVITGCSASTNGGGIYLLSGGSVSITGSTLSNNTASAGGAIDMNGAAAGLGSLTVNTSQFLNNIATTGAGIKMAHGGPLSLTNSTMAGNSASSLGGAAYLVGSPASQTYTISNSTLANNTALSGGAVCENNNSVSPTLGGTLNVTSSTITGNVSTTSVSTGSGYGGAINLFKKNAYGWTNTFDNSIISGNTSGNTGANIVDQVPGSSVSLQYCDINNITGFTLNDLGGNQYDPYSNLKIASTPLAYIGAGGATVGVLPVYTGSPLINHGDTALNGTKDERGVTRLGDSSTSAPVIGAFERTAGPDAVLSLAPNVTVGGATTYTFKVTYSDSVAINLASLGNNNVAITTPAGVPAVTNLQYEGVDSSNPNSVVATYQFTPPAGSWVGSDNGVYSVNVGNSPVNDTNGSAAAASTGTFAVAVSQTFTVTNILDDGSVGSLRWALNQANNDSAVSAPDVIAFSNTTAGGQTNFYDGSVHTITLTSALPWITDPLTINGPTLIGGVTVPGGGTPAVTITRGGTAGAMRIFNSNPSWLNLAGSENVVTLNNLTLTGASSSLAGGAINVTAANLSLSNMLIQNNFTSNNGGGIADSAPPSATNNNFASTLTVANSTIVGNTGAAGGGIDIVGAGMTLNVSSSTLQNNKATSTGGAITIGIDYVTLTGDTITGNSASGAGGGINDGTSGNSVYGLATLAVSNSTIANNTGSTGGGILGSGAVTVTSSTISGNTATGNTGGGGIYFNGVGASPLVASCSVSNSTIANNLALNGGGILSFELVSATFTLNNDTITGNTATNANSVPGQGGGGISVPTQNSASAAFSGSVQLDNTIVSGNFAVNGRNDIAAVASTTPQAAVTVNAVYSAIGSTNGFKLTDNGHNLIGANLLLGPLQNNGGTNATVALVAGSAAIDAGDPAYAGTMDERGTSRPQGGGVDIGAYERVANTIAASAAVTNVTPTNAPATYQFTVDYADDAAINPGQISGSNVTLTLPAGVTASAISVANVNSSNPNHLIVTYQFSITGGWTAASNGLYTVNMVPSQVSDVNGSVAGGALAVFTATSATTFTVTSTADAGTGSNGAGDLRYCITQANAISPNPAIIVFSNSAANGATNFYDGSQHSISLGSTALPSINNNLTITGPGANFLTITRPTSGALNLLLLSPLAANAYRLADTISGVTFSGAQSSALGAALEDVNAVALTLNNVNIVNNSASTSGTGFFNSTAGTSVTLNNCLVQGNTTAALGAGLDMNAAGQLTINNSIINANTAAGNGGAGIVIGGNQNVFLNVANSTISNNKSTGTTSSANGAGIEVLPSATFASVFIDHSTISGNSAGGTIGGGGVAFNGTVGAGGVTIQQSTIANNTAVSGGGIALGSSTSAFQGTVNIVASTITGNSATSATAGYGNGGGGVAVIAGAGTVALDSSIVSGNNAANGNNDITVVSGATATSTYDAIGSSTGFAYTQGTGDLPLGSALNLQALTNNGGPTSTIALGVSSAAINAGDPALAGTTDQRGVNRPQGAGVDIGAFEVSVAPAPTVSTVVVNNNQAQSSSVTTLQVTFSTQVNLGSGAFTLTRVGTYGGAAGDGATLQSSDGTIAVATQVVSGQTVATLTFSGANTVGGSLNDGNWTLTVNHAAVTNATGGTPMAADYAQAGIKRLYGDFDGSGTVNALDYGHFRLAYGTSSGDPAYVAFFDYDASGAINAFDYGQFRLRYGLSM